MYLIQRRQTDPRMLKLTGKSQKNELRIMANKYPGRFSTTISNVDLNTLIEVKKANDLNINFDNDSEFKDNPNEENKITIATTYSISNFSI